jgi:hypothetical protein
VAACEAVRFGEEALANLAGDELAHSVEVGFEALKLEFVLTFLLFTACCGVRQPGS